MPRRFQSARFADLILDNAREYAMFSFGEDGVVTAWSPGAERVFRASADEMVGQSVDLIFTPSDLAAGAAEQERRTAREQGRAEDSRWHVRRGGERFWGNGVTLRTDDPEYGGYLKIVRDETRAKLADEQRILLLNELNHRVKNTLATVQSISEQTLRAGHVDLGVRENLAQRLQALSQAHDVLVTENWAGADLRAVVDKTITPHAHAELPRFTVDGPPVWISPQQAVSISLSLHELATNAVKHGALKAPSGRVAITWNTANDGEGRRYMTLLWEESGGPPVAPPGRSGFGTRLIARTFADQIGGRSHLDFRPEGLRCVLDLPLSLPGETPMFDPSQG